VDDEARIRSIIRKYAEFEGHTVTEAGDGMAAVHLAKKADFDIIILDIETTVLAYNISIGINNRIGNDKLLVCCCCIGEISLVE
jgi:CheY-like chemotaxis protein